MYELVLKGGTLVSSDDVFIGDIALHNGRVAAVGEGLEAEEVLDVSGKILLPGAIDPHVHMALPVAGTHSCDDFASGTIAAATGGVTTILDFTVGSHNTTLTEDLKKRLETAKNSVIDYAFHSEIVGWTPARLDEMRAVSEMGVRSFKFFTAYAASGRRIESGPLLESLYTLAELDALAVVHAEDESIIQVLLSKMTETEKSEMSALAASRPDICEASAIHSVAWLARTAEAQVHIMHLSSLAGLQEVVKAQKEGTKITAETCPQYLLLTEDVYNHEDARLYSASPALRTLLDQQALWHALANGDISFLSTDHCPFSQEQKTWQGSFERLPYGLPGVELMLPLAYSEGVMKGRISLTELATLTSSAAAKLYGLFPRKGSLLPGADADIAILDPEAEWVITPSLLHSKCDFSPYSGLSVQGKVWATFSRGRLIYKEGTFSGQLGYGRFLAR